MLFPAHRKAPNLPARFEPPLSTRVDCSTTGDVVFVDVGQDGKVLLTLDDVDVTILPTVLLTADEALELANVLAIVARSAGRAAIES